MAIKYECFQTMPESTVLGQQDVPNSLTKQSAAYVTTFDIGNVTRKQQSNK